MANSEAHKSRSSSNATHSTEHTPRGERMANVWNKRGGWVTFPFIVGSTLGLGLAGGGAFANIIVFLIRRFNVKSIDAAQFSNIINGCTSLFPVAGAIIADSFSGCFSVIVVSSLISLLGVILLTLTATLDSLRPPSCALGSHTCESPSKGQIAVLYTSIALVAVGIGGSRFTTATMGADQFDKPIDRHIFFNWYFFTVYVVGIISATGFVYIQDNVGWGLGFGLTVVANVVGAAVFLAGNRYYHNVKPKGSPFTRLARVVIAAIRKRKEALSSESEDYYYGHGRVTKLPFPAPTQSFRFLNRAALKTQGDTHPNGSIAKPWRLCTVQEVEDLKRLIKNFPLWSTSILLSTTIGVQMSLTVLQALNTDRHLGRHFEIPASSILVFALLATAVSLFLLDRIVYPMVHKLTRKTQTPLQRLGMGHTLNFIGMAGSALVESKRLHVARSHHLANVAGSIVPMSAMWLVPPLVIVGIGEALHFPGQVALYYQEFPVSMRGTATGMIALIVGLGFYLSTALVDVVRNHTGWLPDNINNGRLDNVYWLLVVLGVLNFGYYLICARLYEYQSIDQKVDIDSDSVG